jgi:hypothetical protein
MAGKTVAEVQLNLLPAFPVSDREMLHRNRKQEAAHMLSYPFFFKAANIWTTK